MFAHFKFAVKLSGHSNRLFLVQKCRCYSHFQKVLTELCYRISCSCILSKCNSVKVLDKYPRALLWISSYVHRPLAKTLLFPMNFCLDNKISSTNTCKMFQYRKTLFYVLKALSSNLSPLSFSFGERGLCPRCNVDCYPKYLFAICSVIANA